jgi:hypothetical protein
MAEKEYKRLAPTRQRTTFGIFSVSRSSLWLGNDHILMIDGTGYTENYKRFFFRDIQAISFRKTVRWIIRSLSFGVLVVLFAVCIRLTNDITLRYIYGSVAAFFALVILIDLAMGPTCIAHLRTAVQTEELPSLNRLRRGRRVLARLRPLIAEAQGQLSPEELPGRLQAWSGVSATTATTPGSITPQDSTAPSPAPTVDNPDVPPRIVS